MLVAHLAEAFAIGSEHVCIAEDSSWQADMRALATRAVQDMGYPHAEVTYGLPAYYPKCTYQVICNDPLDDASARVKEGRLSKLIFLCVQIF